MQIYLESMEELQQDADIKAVIDDDRAVKAFRKLLQTKAGTFNLLLQTVLDVITVDSLLPKF